ncbi:MAG: polyphosphate kinase 1, partial [Pseudomonadota bacterium]|nr:polyphosphate kinase 1 [Pseudomonadota bacterium]
GLVQQAEGGSAPTGAAGLTATELRRALDPRVHERVADQYQLLNEVLTPLLEQEGIRFIPRHAWSPEQRAWLHDYFRQELRPVLSPLSLDPAHPFPRILNKSLNFIIDLDGKDAFGRESGIAVVQAPRALPRLIRLPQKICDDNPYHFVFLSSVIHAHVNELFAGMQVQGCYQFRVTRNSDLFVDVEEVDDLRRALEGELLSRRYGDAVRLETAPDCPQGMIDYLLAQFELTTDSLYKVDGPVNLGRLEAIYDLVDRPDHKYRPFTPGLPAKWTLSHDIFDLIAREDLLLHHPYESFLPVSEFVRQAANDPAVLSIRQTLYRTGPDSAIVDALVAAARAGKEVTVAIELRARFDEEANIALARRLEEAGAHVVYGVVGYKTHAKLILILRREKGQLRHYAHLGTGNYHPKTARFYTDYGLFTADQEICDDLYSVFLQLTAAGEVREHRLLLHSPFDLHSGLLQRIEREIEHANAGRSARIVIKVNSLVEPALIEALYRASNAGVQVDLIVRGMCALRPGVPGASENIRVRSVVGRFLEHSRVFYFHNGGDEEIFGASADWMERNLFRRVETAFPIRAAHLRSRVIQELERYLADQCNAWTMQADGSYLPPEKPGDGSVCAQQQLLESLAERG